MRARTIIVYLALWAAAVFVPLMLWQANLALISNTYGDAYEPFELFGLSGAVALGLVGASELRRRRRAPFEAQLPVLLWVLVSFVFLTLVSELSIKMWDWGCYEGAGRAINEGHNPYEGGCYYYPPFTAQSLAIAYRLVKAGAAFAGWETSRLFVWNLIFYFYQCGQFLLISLAFWLCYRFVRDLALRPAPAACLVATLLLVNNALFRTLRFNQVNLWVLNLELAAILGAARYPALAGLAVAVAGHIKLYPFVLLGPWTLTRCGRVVAWALGGALGIILLQTRLGQDWRLWSQYLVAPFADPKVAYFRNNSLQSAISNLLVLTARVFQVDVAGGMLVNLVQIVAIGAVLAWFAVRFWRRERVCGSMVAVLWPAPIGGKDVVCQYGHAADALALALLVSPSAWEHHYVFALPLILWSAAVCGSRQPYKIGIAALLMLAVPTFDVFPLSYHRLAGLLMLLCVTSMFSSDARSEATQAHMQTGETAEAEKEQEA